MQRGSLVQLWSYRENFNGWTKVPWINPNSTLLYICNDTKERFNSYFTSGGIQLNTPALITIVWNNQTITSYVNGIAQATVSYPSPLILAQSTAKFYLKV